MNNTTYLILLLLFFTTTAVGICQTPDGASLHGTFVDAENGQPIPEVLVRADAEKIASVYPVTEISSTRQQQTQTALSH